MVKRKEIEEMKNWTKYLIVEKLNLYQVWCGMRIIILRQWIIYRNI